MHPMFIELFLEPDADDLVAEEDRRRRRVRRSRRALSVMVIRPSERQVGDMTATDLTHRPLRELASRVAGGVETTLSWDEDTGALTVWVRDRASGGRLRFAAAPDKALYAFYHPYACAAAIDAAR